MAEKSRACCSYYFYIHRVVHCGFVPQGHTVNQHFYKNVLEKVERATTTDEMGPEVLLSLEESLDRVWFLEGDNMKLLVTVPFLFFCCSPKTF